MWEAPALAGAFFKPSSIVADWVKLLCKLYLFVFMELGGLGLTSVFAGVFAKEK
jgi:hypothetical protein